MKHASLIAGVLFVGAPLAAQPAPSVPAPAPTPAPAPIAPAAKPTPLPPGILLGRRVAAVDTMIPAIPVVEIAPDSGAYLAAIERWSIEGGIWPVLIDDGTDRAREDIGRLVRAYKPKRVVHLPSVGRVDPAELETHTFQIVRNTWEAREGQLLETRWKEARFTPQGVIAANAVDPAWTAAVALAAGRGQPIVWFLAQLGAPSGQMEASEAHDIDKQVRDALAKTPWTFNGLGDDIDAITLCASIGGRVVNEPGVKGGGPVALTDVLGRGPAGRWAWAGWIFGTEATAAYTAMCSLFVEPDSGWLFDSYGAKFPPEYACRAALPLFEHLKDPVVITDPQGATLHTWRGRCDGGIDGTLVQVNTMGMFNWFKLTDANAWSSEIPMLLRPALVSFTHSFSAQYISAPNSISGRWLEEGAYGYVGAIDEPNLGAFIPPNILFSRILAGGAWGYAPRFDDGPPWKVQVFGDPLKAVGPKRRIGDVPDRFVEGAHPLDDEMKFQLESQRFPEAIASLVMLGRDPDAVRLARSVLAKGGLADADKPALARAALRPAFRAKDADLFVSLYELLPKDVAARDGERALLWQILRDQIETGQLAENAVTLLMLNTRTESVVDDTAAIRSQVARALGDQAVQKMYQRLIDETKDETAKQSLRKAMGR